MAVERGMKLEWVGGRSTLKLFFFGLFTSKGRSVYPCRACHCWTLWTNDVDDAAFVIRGILVDSVTATNLERLCFNLITFECRNWRIWWSDVTLFSHTRTDIPSIWHGLSYEKKQWPKSDVIGKWSGPLKTLFWRMCMRRQRCKFLLDPYNWL